MPRRIYFNLEDYKNLGVSHKEVVLVCHDDLQLIKQFYQRFDALYLHFGMSCEALGVRVGQIAQAVKSNPVYMAIIIDDLEYFKRASEPYDNREKVSMLTLSFAAGARKIGTYLCETMPFDIKKLKLKTQSEYLALLTFSRNTEWLIEIAKSIGMEKLPSLCNSHTTGFDGLDYVKSVNEQLTLNGFHNHTIEPPKS